MMSLITVENLEVGYGRTPVIQGVSTNFSPGRVTALVGPNGCGKSTLLKAIMGFLPVSRGHAMLDGEQISKIGRKALARRIAYLPQECHCPDYMTLGELVELGAYGRQPLAGGPSESDRALFRQALETVGLADRSHCHVNTLSGGQRQRAWIAMVLAQNTDIILMDEPVNHLDMKYQYAVMLLVRNLSRLQGKTVIVVLHDLNLASAFTDEVIMLRAGKIAASGSVRETMTTENIADVFDLETDIFPHDGRLVCLPRLADVQQVAS